MTDIPLRFAGVYPEESPVRSGVDVDDHVTYAKRAVS